MLKITLLGPGGMMPLKERALTSLYAVCEGRALLIDCGEGTQVQIRTAGLSFKAIDLLLLTHYHADHVSGLPGLLLSMGNQGRTAPLTIAGPPGLRRIVSGLRVIAPELPFDIEYQALDTLPMPTLTCGRLQITPFPLQHQAMPCVGYRLHLPRAGKFSPVLARQNGVPLPCWHLLQEQPSVTFEGVSYTREMVMGPDRRGITVVYATDTRPLPVIEEMAHRADLLITEAMYGDPDKQSSAIEKGHMMMWEAAQLGQAAQPDRLWLTHFSPAMTEPEAWLPDALAIFPLAELGSELKTIDLPFIDAPGE